MNDQGRIVKMKTCPICAARCFDDMEVCYGCMHRFDEAGSPQRQDVESGSFSRERKEEGVACGSAPALLARVEGFAEASEVATLLDGAQGACARWELVVSLRPVGQAAVEGADC